MEDSIIPRTSNTRRCAFIISREWGCLTNWGPGNLSWIHGTTDSETYVDVFNDYYHATIKFYGKDRITTMLQQDNVSSHTSATTKRLLKKAKIAVLGWPVRPPTLTLSSRSGHISKDGWMSMILHQSPRMNYGIRMLEFWTALPKDFIHRFYASLLNRMKAVYKSRGDCWNI